MDEVGVGHAITVLGVGDSRYDACACLGVPMMMSDYLFVIPGRLFCDWVFLLFEGNSRYIFALGGRGRGDSGEGEV